MIDRKQCFVYERLDQKGIDGHAERPPNARPMEASIEAFIEAFIEAVIEAWTKGRA